jgi:chromosome segregation ATPase
METLQTNGPNPAEEIWAILREAAQRHVENEKLVEETKKLMRESAQRHEENEKLVEETKKLMRESAQRHAENEELVEETKQLMRESAQQHAETDRLMKESAQRYAENEERMKETGRQLKETKQLMRETFDRMDERSKRLDKQLGELSNSFGDMVEHMVIPNLLTKFEQLEFTFTKANRTEIKDREHDIFTEVDALLENGDKVMAVEIKNKQKSDDIDEHIERMKKLRKYADLHNDQRVYLGAVAGVVFSESEKVYALKHGFYVIEPSGETFTITAPTGKYHPHEW